MVHDFRQWEAHVACDGDNRSEIVDPVRVGERYIYFKGKCEVGTDLDR